MKRFILFIIMSVFVLNVSVFAVDYKDIRPLKLNIENLFNIKDYSSFDHYSDFSDEYVLEWTDNDYSITVICDGKGNISHFDYNSKNNIKNKEYTDTQCLSEAEMWLKKITGKNFYRLKLIGTLSNDNEYIFRYYILSNDGKPFTDNIADIRINKYTKNLSEIFINNKLFNIETDGFINTISQKTAENIFFNNIEFTKMKFYNENENKFYIIPVYKLPYYKLSAKTGKFITNSSTADPSDKIISKEEYTEAVEINGNIIPKYKAFENALKIIPVKKCYDCYGEEKDIYSFEMEFFINAINGEIITKDGQPVNNTNNNINLLF